MTAAGIDPLALADGTFDTTALTGLDNAIWHVFQNCVKNPQAPGLVNALEHLVLNRDRHLAQEAAREAAKLARDEAKVARDAAYAARKALHDEQKAAHQSSHGPSGEHGNPHTS
jgi:cobalamin-dependent methionine synthase I